MARSYSVAEARARLASILDEVATGKDVALTRRGKRVAVLLSTDRFDAMRAERSAFGEAYRRFCRRHAVGEIGVDADFIASLRDRRAGRPVRM
jgi:prevent-host-death family protein